MAAEAVMAARSRVAVQVALAELDAGWQQWFSGHPNATDDDGAYIELCFGPDEPAGAVFRAVNRHTSPVFLASILNEGLGMIQVSPGRGVDDSNYRRVPLGPGATVADVFLAMMLHEGEAVVLAFEDAEVLATR